jgi:predicted DCC family thiol-disulfide oxidoreductase YuxK
MPTSRLDRWIHGFIPVTAEGLALSRIFYAAFWLLTGIPTFAWVSANPPGFYSPPPLSLGALFAQFPSAAGLRVLDVAIGLLFLCLLTGFKTKATSILLSLAWIVGNSFRFSFGKIDHTIMAVITPAVMAFSGWGARFSIDAKRGQVSDAASDAAVRAWPLSLLALLLAFGFFSAGLPKLLAWADFDLGTQGARSWLVSGWYGLGHRRLLAPLFIQIGNPYFWEITDLVAVAFEVGFLFSLVRLALFRTFLFTAVMFHFVNLLMLNIAFTIMLPVYVVFAPWERLVPLIPRRAAAFLDRLTSWRGMVVLLVLFAPLYLSAGRVSVEATASGFSHLGALADLLGGFDYPWAVALIVFPIAVVVVLALSGLPQGYGGAGDLLPNAAGPALFFDGACNLCNAFVNFMVVRDRGHRLRFGSLQSEIGVRVDQVAGAIGPREPLRSIVLVDADRRVYRGADAVLKAVIGLGGIYRLLVALWLVPRPIREVAYRLVAVARYKIFGKRETCRVPTPAERALFI